MGFRDYADYRHGDEHPHPELGFGGSLLVKTAEQLQHLERHGPMELLAQVTRPVSGP